MSGRLGLLDAVECPPTFGVSLAWWWISSPAGSMPS